MPVRTVYEVRQRTWDGTQDRLLGLFTDDMMADQAINACYRQVWKVAVTPGFSPTIWVPEEAQELLTRVGWDIWYPNDLNSDRPLFYKVPQQLWDQLPSNINNFTFTLENSWEPMVRVTI
jgi:hypothetical protein